MIITEKELRKAKTKRKGYSLLQIKIGQRITGQQQWKKALIGMSISDDEWLGFVNARERSETKTAKTKYLNAFTVKHDWSWKPQKQDIPPIKLAGKLAKNRGQNKSKRERISHSQDVEFYSSQEWRKLRVRVLEKYSCTCMMCGRAPKTHGVVVHVDHIKPRSKFPNLALCFENLQVLCEDCNLGKGNKFDTDYRPDVLDDGERELLHGALSSLG